MIWDPLAAWPVPNAAAAVVSPDGILATAGDTAFEFRLASVTKPLSALATLVAVEEGALELTDPIEGLPGATLAHLLSHASGLAPDRRERTAEPGTRRIYSNAGFDLIGELVAGVTGIAFAEYLDDAVFARLAMRTAVLDGSPASAGRASVTDLAAVLSELLSPTGLLDPTTLAAATGVQFPGLSGVLPGYGRQADNQWGLGFEVRDGKQPHWTSSRNAPTTYGHFGQSGTMFWIDPVARLGLVALTDRDFGPWAVEAWPVLSDGVLDQFG